MEKHLSSRVTRAQQLLNESGIDALIATSTANFFYFTEKWIDPHERLLAFVIPKTGDPVIIAPALHDQDFVDFPIETVLWNDGTDTIALLAKHLPQSGVISVDNLWPSSNLISLMRERPQLSMIDSNNTIARLRLHKDDREKDVLSRAGQATDRVMEALIGKLRPGMTELELAEELRLLWMQAGASGMSFNPIIGAGANGASPHHQTGHTTIRSGDMIVIDMGGILEHYCSDITRTIAVGDITDEARNVYEVVRRAQQAGVDAVRAGIPIGSIDKLVRDIIVDAGYGQYFLTRTGHGLGIEIHEEPYVFDGNDEMLEAGMVFSIEPGIYLPNQFGVRIEDVVIATETGCQNLYSMTKELQVIDA